MRYSIKRTRNIEYSEQIEAYFSKTLERSDSLYLGEPSESIKKSVLSSNPLVMNHGDIRKSNEKTAKNKKYSRHGVPRKFFRNMKKHLNESVMFYKNDSGVTVVTDFLMLDEKEQPSYVIAGVKPDVEMENEEVNLVKSVYPLDDFSERIMRNAEGGQLIITDKQKAREMLATVGVQPSEVSKILELSKESIHDSTENVKRKQLEIRRRQPNESANREKHPNTFEELPSSTDSISNSTENVKQNSKKSLSSPNTAPKKYGNYNVYGEDVMLEGEVKPKGKAEITAPTRESIAEEKKKVITDAPIRADVKKKFPMLDEDDVLPIKKDVNSLKTKGTESEQILGESQLRTAEPKKNNIRAAWKSFLRNFVSKGAEVETYALKGKNRGVEDKYRMWKDRSEA